MGISLLSKVGQIENLFKKLKTSFLRNRTKMYQVDFQDFSDFAHNGFLSALGQSISKNHNFRFSVAMDTKL